MSKELKPEMWENAVHFLEQIRCEDVKDVSWEHSAEGAIKKITITFEHPIFQTGEPPELERPQENKLCQKHNVLRKIQEQAWPQETGKEEIKCLQ